jgi:hypothetical protein
VRGGFSVLPKKEWLREDSPAVFALLTTKARCIDPIKRDALSRILFEESRQAVSGDKLEEKLATVSLGSTTVSSKWLSKGAAQF